MFKWEFEIGHQDIKDIKLNSEHFIFSISFLNRLLSVNSLILRFLAHRARAIVHLHPLCIVVDLIAVHLPWVHDLLS